MVEPWIPADRWETPPRSEVKESPETEWFLWIDRIVYKIEVEGRMDDFKTEGTRHYPYYGGRFIDDVCMHAFGSKLPTKEGVFLSHGTVIARMFARGTQSRADLARSLKTEAQELLEQHGPI